ncbi:MAG TPA: hypothetical protein VJ063_18135 [Verrucomicrobiae bacterium]|nr:hypothetical protein [Verrucomicrobiae bacterium]
MNQEVIALREYSEELPFHAQPFATRAQKEQPVLFQVPPILHSGGRFEISQQLRPVIAICLAQQLQESLPLAARGGLFQRHFEQNAVPPAHFVVAVIADHSRVVAQGHDLFARDPVHALRDLRVPHVPPRRSRGRSDMQHWRKCYIRVAALLQRRKVAPPAHGGETPRPEPLQRSLSPTIRIRIVLPRRIAGIVAIELLARRAHAHATDTKRKKTLSIWPFQPRYALMLLNRKWFSC